LLQPAELTAAFVVVVVSISVDERQTNRASWLVCVEVKCDG